MVHRRELVLESMPRFDVFARLLGILAHRLLGVRELDLSQCRYDARRPDLADREDHAELERQMMGAGERA